MTTPPGTDIPCFDDLPAIEQLGLRHCWGVFGQDDSVGTLNFLTPAARRRGLAAAVGGDAVGLCLPLSEPDPPMYERPPYQHTVFASGRNTNDDYLDRFYLQGSTQWDGLRHVRCREFGLYGGYTGDLEADGGVLGIEHWAATGIIGRGTLADVARYCADTGRDYDPFSGEGIKADLIAAALEHQRTSLEAGDILCVHFGWMERYFALAKDERPRTPGRAKFAGLEGSQDVARFLWNARVAALACDNPAVEVSPGDASIGSLHRRVIPMLGLALGELFDFRELAVRCASRARWEFCFVSVPLNLPGGVGSPGNAVAVL